MKSNKCPNYKKNLTVKTELKVVRTSIDPLALVVADVRLLGHLLVLRDGDGSSRLDTADS